VHVERDGMSTHQLTLRRMADRFTLVSFELARYALSRYAPARFARAQAFSVDYDAPQAYTAATKAHLEYTVLGKMNTAPGSYKREWKPRGGGALFE
jgi:hypothetical protein